MTHCGMGSRGSDAGSKQGWEYWGEGQGRLCVALQGDPAGQGSPLCAKESSPRLTQHPASSCKGGLLPLGANFYSGKWALLYFTISKPGLHISQFPNAHVPSFTHLYGTHINSRSPKPSFASNVSQAAHIPVQHQDLPWLAISATQQSLAPLSCLNTHRGKKFTLKKGNIKHLGLDFQLFQRLIMYPK